MFRLALNAGMLLMVAVELVGCARTSVQAQPGLDLSGKRVGVLPFYCTVPDVGATVSDAVATNLMDANLHLIERSYLTNVLVERNILQGEQPDKALRSNVIVKGVESLDLPRLQALNLVDYLLVGTVTASMSSMAVSSYGAMGTGVSRMTTLGAAARMIDVRTGEVVLSLSYSPATIYDVPYDIGRTMARAIKKKIQAR